MAVDYEQAAKTYDNTRGVDERLIERIAERVVMTEGLGVLDFGCGTGSYLSRLRRDYGVRGFGVDPSAEMRRLASGKDARLTIRAGDHRQIPFEDASIELAMAIDVIHHVTDTASMFAEFRRVLVPAGQLCIATESHAQIEARFYNRYFPSLSTSELRRYPAIDTLIENACDSGLSFLEAETLPQEGVRVVDDDFLANVSQKNYSMFRLLPEDEFTKGLQSLAQDRGRAFDPGEAGQTLLWFQKPG